MADTPEVKVKAAIRQVLKSFGAYWHSPVQNGMGTPALDFHICHYGHYAGIEAKAPGKKLTPRQLLTKRDIEAAGGRVFVIGEEDYREVYGQEFPYSGLGELSLWLEGIQTSKCVR